MIALDTSAIVAIALVEAEEEAFVRAIAMHDALLGTPTLLESRLVLTPRMPDHADRFIERILARPSVHLVDFSAEMYHAAADAFDRFGKGRGHLAKLNFGDCMAYAVARVHNAPLLYKGDDFTHTDITPALP